jgi:hypothetical protein
VLLDDDHDTHFTMNDFDDAGTCPIILDVVRLLVGTQLYIQNTIGHFVFDEMDDIIKSYITGLDGDDPKNTPKTISDKTDVKHPSYLPSEKAFDNGKLVVKTDNFNENVLTDDDKFWVTDAISKEYNNSLQVMQLMFVILSN